MFAVSSKGCYNSVPPHSCSRRSAPCWKSGKNTHQNGKTYGSFINNTKRPTFLRKSITLKGALQTNKNQLLRKYKKKKVSESVSLSCTHSDLLIILTNNLRSRMRFRRKCQFVTSIDICRIVYFKTVDFNESKDIIYIYFLCYELHFF